jgi:hypothetical protein
LELPPVPAVPDCSGGELCCGIRISGDAVSADSEDAAINSAKNELRSCDHRLCTNRISTSGRKKRKQFIPPIVVEMPGARLQGKALKLIPAFAVYPDHPNRSNATGFPGAGGHGHSNCFPGAVPAHPSEVAVGDVSPRAHRGAHGGEDGHSGGH